MRRQDREIKDIIKIEDIVKRCHCCRIGFNDEENVYIVPLNFGYERKADSFVFYFHGAREGRKADLIQTSPYAGFELDTNYKLNEANAACGHSARFQSIIGNGRVQAITDGQEMLHGLKLIMEHNTGKSDWDFKEKMLETVLVFKLDVSEMSCKEHR